MEKEDLYIKYGIDVNRLSRDYLLNPLQRISRKNGGLMYEKPSKDDLLYLYNECYLSMEFIAEVLNVSAISLAKWFKEYEIDRKNKDLTKKIREKTNLIKFGVKNYSTLNECKEKVKQTNLERYGFESVLKNKEIKEKVKQTNLERYGVEHPQSLEIIKQKQKETDRLNHNGVLHQQTKEFGEKVKDTCIRKYGVNIPMLMAEVKEKVKQTNLKRYGVINPSFNESVKKKISETNKLLSEQAKVVRKQTCLERYGTTNYMHYQQSNGRWDILADKDVLKQFIEDNNIMNASQLSDMLNISVSVVCKKIREYDLSNLFDYTGSLAEKEIREYINQYYVTENNTRKYLDGKEIDIYIPKLKIGIEFNGNFYHNEYGKDRLYHQEKSLLGESKGIFIYHIFEYEWLSKKKLIINQLNNLLGINCEKIYARKCIIKEVVNKDKKIFLETNHLQGNDSSSIKLGLYYEGELVSLMTFCKPRFNKKYEYELSRFCSKNNCNVIGGASKLWKYFIDNYDVSSVISYSNISHTKGKLYETLGFDLETISEPNYVWCKNMDIKSRYQSQKHKLLEQGFIGNSEEEIMCGLNYYRIYDCGNKVWVYKKGVD